MSDVVVEELTRDERKQLLIPPGVHADRVRLSNGDVIIVCGFYHIELDNLAVSDSAEREAGTCL